MKKKPEALVNNKKEDKKEQSPLYTIQDRYKNFCRQGHMISGDIDLDDKYLNRWFIY